MPENMVPEWEIPARDLYMEYPQRQRDEAVRTGTFGAAAMIYAARSLGLGSTPMSVLTPKRCIATSDWPRAKCRSCCCPWGRSVRETGRKSRAVRSPMCWISSELVSPQLTGNYDAEKCSSKAGTSAGPFQTNPRCITKNFGFTPNMLATFA